MNEKMNTQTMIALAVIAVIFMAVMIAAIIIVDKKQEQKRAKAPPEIPRTVHCYNCGAVIPDGYRYCPVCEWWRDL